MSKMVGEVQIERIRESRSHAGLNGKTQKSFSTETREERLVMASEFAGLPDLTGIFRYGNEVVKIELALTPERNIARSFIPRPPVAAERAPLMSIPEYRELRNPKPPPMPTPIADKP